MSIVYPRDSKEANPPLLYPDYKSTLRRAPVKPLIIVPHTLTELTGPVYGHESVRATDHDLTKQHAGEPIGERIIVHGRVMDENGRGVPDTLVEIWQANSCGRYTHVNDQHPAPLDPNFTGAGRVLTDAQGNYKFVTVKPGAYPWRNWVNNWRPAHIHVSVFGTAFAQRLITQMYFEGDPLIAKCPIVQTIPDARAIEQLIAPLDMNAAIPLDCLAYKFDIVLRGRRSTLFENRMEGN